MPNSKRNYLIGFLAGASIGLLFGIFMPVVVDEIFIAAILFAMTFVAGALFTQATVGDRP